MSRVRSFKGERGAEGLRNIGVIATILFILLVLFLFAFALGWIQPIYDNLMGITPPPTYSSSATNPISVRTLVFDYTNNGAAGILGKTFYVTGNITGFQNPGITEFGSCIALNLTNPYDCSDVPGSSYWIIWQFRDTSEAYDISVGTNFIADCTVSGMTGNDLFLDSCQSVSL